MKKSAQDREIEKLKKQVEKLKKEKESLQRDKRNLKGRLSTAQSNNAKYRSVLKKKRETERWIGQVAKTEHSHPLGSKRVRDATLLSIFQFFTFAARI